MNTKQILELEYQHFKNMTFDSPAEEKRYTKANNQWAELHSFMKARVREKNPDAWAKMTCVELRRPDGPRRTILKRLIGKHYRLLQLGVSEEAFKEFKPAKKASAKKVPVKKASVKKASVKKASVKKDSDFTMSVNP